VLLCVEQVIAADPGPGREARGEYSEEDREVRDGARAQVEIERVPSPRIKGADQQHGHEVEAQRPVDDRVQERQRQQVKRDVLAEHRVGGSSRRRMLEEGQRLPLRAGAAGQDQRDQRRADEGDDSERAAER
jgi:hypothetical protein